MNKEFEKMLFAETEEFFSERGTEVFYDDIDGKKVLVMEFGEENAPADCTVSVIEPDDDITAINIMFTLVSEYPGTVPEDMVRLPAILNKYLTIGNFGFVQDSGYFYFSCSLIVDESADITETMKLFLSTWEVAYNTSAEGLQVIMPVVNGSLAVNALDEDEASIIQF